MTTDLIARLGAATVGSRELSNEVLIALGWRELTLDEISCYEYSGDIGLYWPTPKGGLAYSNTLPDPTCFLDIALTMVTTGWRTVDAHQSLIHTPAWSWKLQRWYDVVEGKGHTHALAACIASLRAKEIVHD